MSAMEKEVDKQEISLDSLLDKPQLYEVSYLFTSNISEEDAQKEVEILKERITQEEGTILDGVLPKVITLAYPMSKMVANKRKIHDTAYFGWIKIELFQDKIDIVKSYLDAHTNVLRHLIIKTVKEAPAPKKRTTIKKILTRDVKPAEIQEEKKPVDDEKLDKELEELLTA
tara:strand:+ start:2827 stop:3339 length:513 start_codon:yes stop_codon:yes gene_type:complete